MKIQTNEITKEQFRNYNPSQAARDFVEKGKASGAEDIAEICNVIDAIVNDEWVQNPQLAGNLFELILLDAALTDFLSPKHGLDTTLLARRSNQPVVDFVTFSDRKAVRLYQVKWCQDELDALHAVQDAWGTLEPYTEVFGAEAHIIVNHPIQKHLVGRQRNAVRVVLGSQLSEWWEKRFKSEIQGRMEEGVRALSAPSVYRGTVALTLNPIQEAHLVATVQALKLSRKACWHICTGYGKTVLGLAIIEHYLKNFAEDDVAIVAVPRLALAGQWRTMARRYREFNNVGIEIFGTYEAAERANELGEDEEYREDEYSDEVWDRHGTTDAVELFETLSRFPKKVVVSTYQSLYKLTSTGARKYKIQLLLADEFHRAGGFFKGQGGKTHWSSLEKRDGTSLIIASATIPYGAARRVGIKNSTCYLNLDQALNEPKYADVLARGTHARLCELRGLVRLARKSDTRKDLIEFITRTLPEFVREKNHWDSAYPVKILVFCRSISHATELRDLLRSAIPEKLGVAYAVSSSRRTSDESLSAQKHLRRALKAFQEEARSLSYVTNANILTEGVDIPTCNAVLILSPRSYPTATQIIGRAIRATKGKKCGVVAFYGEAADEQKAELGIDRYRRYIEATVASAYAILQAVEGTGNRSELPSGNRSDSVTVLTEDGPATQSASLQALKKEVARVRKEFGLTRELEPKSISVIQKKKEILNYIKTNKALPPLDHALYRQMITYRASDPKFFQEVDAIRAELGISMWGEDVEENKAKICEYIKKHKRLPSAQLKLGIASNNYRRWYPEFKMKTDALLKEVGAELQYQRQKRIREEIRKFIKENKRLPPTSTELGRSCNKMRKRNEDYKAETNSLLASVGGSVQAEKARARKNRILAIAKKTGQLPWNDPELSSFVDQYRQRDTKFRAETEAILDKWGNPIKKRRFYTKDEVLAFVVRVKSLPTKGNILEAYRRYCKKDKAFEKSALLCLRSAK